MSAIRTYLQNIQKLCDSSNVGKNVVILFYDSLNCLLIHITLRNVQEGEYLFKNKCYLCI